MTCQDIQEQLGEHLDGELGESRRVAVEAHLSGCPACRRQFESLEELAAVLRPHPDSDAAPPPELWRAIEARLDEKPADTPASRTSPRIIRLARRPLATAAAILLATAIGWLAFNAPWESRALAAGIDFRPLLDRSDGDIQAGIEALMKTYGGEPITPAEAARRMTVRIRVPESLPVEMPDRSTYMLNLGAEHRALAFHLSGPKGHLLLLQCPAGISKNYGGHECMSCHVDGQPGQVARAGPLRLMHFESDNVCVCVVSTLDEVSELPAVLAAIAVDF